MSGERKILILTNLECLNLYLVHFKQIKNAKILQKSILRASNVDKWGIVEV